MNKIELSSKKGITLKNDYCKFVFDETKSKLAFLIGIYAIRKGKLKFKFLKENTFNVNGQDFPNDLKNVTRKTILNTLFNKSIKVNDIDYGQLTKETIFKTVYKKHSLEIADLIFLYNNLEVILFSKLTSIKMKTILRELAGKFNTILDRNIFEFTC